MQAALCFLFLLVAGISAKPLYRAPGSPAGSCGSKPSCELPSKIKFAYEQGKVYTYDVQSSVKTSTSSDPKSSGLQVSAQAKIGAIQNCELELELSSVELKDDQGNKINDKKFLEDLTLPLRFEWNDGRIGDVCPTDEKDSQWSLNFKRSVLSAFQNSMDSLDNAEPLRVVDAAGDCWANYEVESSDATRKVVKWTKDLNQCADRQGGMVATYGVKYTNPMSDINTMPLTEGKQECTQTTEKRIVKSVDCKERLSFMPTRLAEGAATVVTEATMRIKLVSESSEQASAPEAKYTSDLKFDHSYVPADVDADVADAEKLIEKMCKEDGEVVAESGRDFSDLLDVLRGLSKDEIAKVYSAASKCKATQKMINNIIPDVATTEASRFLVEKVEAKEPKESTIREDWLASLRGVLSPAKEILEKAARIVVSDDEYTITGRAYLGVGSALNNFCAKNKDCHLVPEVKAAISLFVNPLNACKSSSADRQVTRRAVYALRALGNAGAAIAQEAMPEVVSQCMTNKALPAELRLSALSVLRRVPCGKENEKASETLRVVMRDSSDDTEFRSYALIAALRCPCMMDLEAVRTVITDDKTNEKFGAFVVSFVSRMEESPMSNYWEPEFRSTVSALMATRQAAEFAMKIDAMKTGISMNRQQFWPQMNAGYMYDADLIHSDKSVFPRIARVNVSMAAFGRAINPIEIGIRQEGIESLLDTIPEMDVIEKPEGLMELPRINTDKLKPMLDKLKLSLFVRVFGSEVRYASVDKEVLDRLRERLRNRIDIQSLSDDEGRQGAELFIDRALSLPTVSGLPIRMSVRGSYRSLIRPSMNPEAKRDSEGRMTSINIKADVKAGLSVELRQSMSAYIGARQYGVQAVTRMVSQAEYKPEFIFEGRHLKIKVDMPSKTIRAASLTNEVTIRRDKIEEPVTTDAAVRRAEICTPGVTGVKLCFQTEMPSRWQGPLTPGKVAMTLEKIDEQMKGIEVEFRADHALNGEGKLETVDFKAYVDTPGSAKDRKLLAQLSVSRPERQISAALETPWKKATMSVKMTGDNDNSEIKATLAIGEEQSAKRNYNVAVTRSSSSVKDGSNTYPKRNVQVTITRDDVSKAILKASGSVTDMGEKKDISVRVEELHIPNYYTMASPASLNGEFGKDDVRGYGFMVKGKTESRDFETEFGIKVQPEGRQIVYSHRLHHQSSAAGTGDDKFDRSLLWEVEFKREPTKILMVKSILRSMDVPFVDRASHKVVLRLERPTQESLETELDAEIGTGADAKRAKLSQKIDWHRMETMRGFNYQLNIAASNMIDRTIAISSHREWSPKALIQFDAEVRRGDIAIYHVSLFGRRDAPGYGELKFRTFCPYSDFMILAKGEKTDEYTSVHSFRLERNGDLRVNFESKARIDAQRRDVDAKLELMGMAPITLNSRGSGSPFDGKWQHDGSLSYGARKLLFGGNVQYNPVADNEGILDANVYAGTLERMFKQYINWHRVDKQVKVRGMTELGDDMYKVSADLDMEARRHRVTVEAPRGTTQITFGRLSNQRGFDVAVDHSCSSIELRLTAKAGLDKLRSDIVGSIDYKMPGEETWKTMSFKSGYKADMSEGIDMGFFSGVKVNDKEWFANSNVTVIPGRKIALAFGAGDGDNYRHRFAILGSRKWESETVLRLDGEIEVHCTALSLPRLKVETYKKMSWNKEQRLGAYETRVQVIRGDKEMWYAIDIDAMNPREAGKLMIKGDSSITKPVELSLSYTASLPTVTIAGTGRVGERRGSMRGLIEVTKIEKSNVDVSYSISFYSARSEEAEISIRGQHQGDFKTEGKSFLTVEAKDFPYAINTRWNNGEEKLSEVIIRTPHENYRENVIRISSRKESEDLNTEVLIKVGPKVNLRSTMWRKVEAGSRRGEVRVDNNGRIWAVGYTLDHPENAMLTRGEHRLRLRVDTPVDGYKTNTVLFWIKPASKGMTGIATVMGLSDAEKGLKEQRSQMQFAYQIGEEKKGGIMFSARGERNYETSKLFREVSLSVKLPRFNFSIDVESTRVPEKGNGWVEYRSDRFGNWRAEWSGSGSLSKAGSAHIELRGKTADREEPIIIRLSSNHDLTEEKKEVTGQIATNMPGYDRIRLRATQSLNDDGDIATTVELMMPNEKTIMAEFAVGFTIEQIDLKAKLTTPFEPVRELAAEFSYKNEAPKHSVDLKFNRNERKYVFQVSAEKTDDSISGDLKIETPFPALSSASGNFKRTGLLFSAAGSKTTAELIVNKATTLKVESEGKMVGAGKYISTVIEFGKERYVFEINKPGKEGKFELRIPTPWSCTIHYDGEINTRDNIYAVLRRHHTCSPYSFAGEITVSLADTKQLLIKLETPIPYFKTLDIDVSYDFDEATYQIEERMPPIGLKVTVTREGKVGKMVLNINPDERSATLTATIREVTISGEARVGNAEGGFINFDITSPYVNVKIQNKREGPWAKPSNVEASMSVANIDVYSLTGSWDFEAYPERYNIQVEGSIYSKEAKLVASGETRGPRDWKRENEFQLGPKTHKTMSEMKDKKITMSYSNSEGRSIKLAVEMDPRDDGAMKTLKSAYEVAQTGYTQLFSNLKWTATYSIPSSVDLKALRENPRENIRKVIRTVLSSVAWDQKLLVDGADKYSTDGSLKVEMPADATLVGLKFEYESNRAWSDKKYSVVLKVNKAQAGPTDIKLKLEVNGEKKIDVAGSIERREKFTNYARVKLDFESPKRMHFDIERDATSGSERVWKALINFDKDVDAEGTEWKLTAKPADGVSARGLDIVVVAKRAGQDYLNVEAGYQRSLTKTFEVRFHLFGKTQNMPKKYGFREEISYENMVLSTKIDFSTLTRDVKAELKTGYEPSKRMYIQGVYDLGTPSSRLEVNIEWQGDKITGQAKLGDRTITLDGTMAATDRHNYELKVNVRDSDSNSAQFNFRKSWSEQSRNRTYDATLKTNNGEIEWHSHRYLADPIRSRGILVRYRKAEWAAGQETVLYAFGEIDMSTPSIRVEILTPFRKAEYSLRREAGENGARQYIARLREDDEKVAIMTLNIDPANSAIDFLSVRADGSRLKVHVHIVSTKYAFFEAKRMMQVDGSYENLVRITVSLDPAQLHANMKYNTQLAEILREYVARRRDQAKELMARYKNSVPEGLKSMHDITMAGKILKPTVEAMRNEREQLRQAERAKWREITKEWYESPVMKKLFSSRIPEYSESVINRWLSEEPMFTVAGVQSTVDGAIVAIGQAVRQFVQKDLLVDMKELRMKAGESNTPSRNSIRAIVGRLRETARDYVIEAIDRLRERTWTSCIVSYIRAMPEKIAARLAEREDLREVRERLQNAVSKARNYFAEMKERYLNADPKTNPLMSGIRDTLSKSEITYSAGEVDAKIVLPKSNMRSLRVPAALARRVESIRELLERGVAAVKARLASPKPVDMSLRRVLGMAQFFRANELRMLLQ